MIRRSPWKILVPVVVVGVLGTGAAIRAQNATTGTLGGVVRDGQQGVLPGASVVATHAPTGTRYEAFTRGDGRFDLLNVQVGPYDLEIALGGFGTQALSGVVVALGEATEVPVTLQLAALTETVEVTAEASALFSPSRSGTTAASRPASSRRCRRWSGACRTSRARTRSSSRPTATPTTRAS